MFLPRLSSMIPHPPAVLAAAALALAPMVSRAASPDGDVSGIGEAPVETAGNPETFVARPVAPIFSPDAASTVPWAPMPRDAKFDFAVQVAAPVAPAMPVAQPVVVVPVAPTVTVHVDAPVVAPIVVSSTVYATSDGPTFVNMPEARGATPASQTLPWWVPVWGIASLAAFAGAGQSFLRGVYQKRSEAIARMKDYAPYPRPVHPELDLSAGSMSWGLESESLMEFFNEHPEILNEGGVLDAFYDDAGRVVIVREQDWDLPELAPEDLEPLDDIDAESLVADASTACDRLIGETNNLAHNVELWLAGKELREPKDLAERVAFLWTALNQITEVLPEIADAGRTGKLREDIAALAVSIAEKTVVYTDDLFDEGMQIVAERRHFERDQAADQLDVVIALLQGVLETPYFSLETVSRMSTGLEDLERVRRLIGSLPRPIPIEGVSISDEEYPVGATPVTVEEDPAIAIDLD